MRSQQMGAHSAARAPLRAPLLEASAAGIARAAEILRAGGLVAFPTETVYGLGADACNPQAVARIYQAKGRPAFNPLIAHTPDLSAALREAVFDSAALKLAERFWPGPLTIVAPIAPNSRVCELARAGLPTIALRVPDHPVALDVLRAFGRPLAAPSANASGGISPATAEHALSDLGAVIDAAIDGGPARVGLESTIVACLDRRCVLLRPGGFTRAEIEDVVGPLASPQDLGVAAPGMLASHYAPRALMRLEATHLEPGEIGLDFAGRLEGARLDLSPEGALAQAAANLYTYLRRLDAEGADVIAVAPIPNEGLGEAIADRLRRAAAPRQS